MKAKPSKTKGKSAAHMKRLAKYIHENGVWVHGSYLGMSRRFEFNEAKYNKSNNSVILISGNIKTTIRPDYEETGCGRWKEPILWTDPGISMEKKPPLKIK